MEETSSQRISIMDDLRAELEGFEAGEGLSRFTGGHGLQSNVFRFSWDEPMLRIDLELPYACVLSEDEQQADDDAEISASMRMAILLLSAAEKGTLLQDGEARLVVTHDNDDLWWGVYDADGNLLDESEEWDSLAARLENALADDAENALTFIWP